MDTYTDQIAGAPMSLRVVIVDDHLIVLDGLRRMIETEGDFRVVSTCRSAFHAIEVIDGEMVDLVVVDLRMPGMSGLDFIQYIRNRRPDLPIVVLTADIRDEDLAIAMQYRVNGIVLKEQAPTVFLSCLRTVAAGGTYFMDNLGSALDRLHERGRQFSSLLQALTPREVEVSRLAADGLRSRAIGDELGISPGTVKLHLHSIYAKLGISTRVELANLAKREWSANENRF
ncbi:MULTISPECIES: response regulator transcription factor [unclassified Ensifer]|uniref:response regulator transcription factor n=1 Tax=unclassified Ensifer TaxID=2633371 RepID=UPI00300FE9B2